MSSRAVEEQPFVVMYMLHNCWTDFYIIVIGFATSERNTNGINNNLWSFDVENSKNLKYLINLWKIVKIIKIVILRIEI